METPVRAYQKGTAVPTSQDTVCIQNKDDRIDTALVQYLPVECEAPVGGWFP